jgi:hypothetical protein
VGKKPARSESFTVLVSAKPKSPGVSKSAALPYAAYCQQNSHEAVTEEDAIEMTSPPFLVAITRFGAVSGSRLSSGRSASPFCKVELKSGIARVRRNQLSQDSDAFTGYRFALLIPIACEQRKAD